MLAVLVGCTPPIASGDDEADETSTSESNTSASSTSESEDTSTSATEDDLNFVREDPDLGPESCSMLLQDCPEGEKCTFYATSPDPPDGLVNVCVAVTGDQHVGEACHLGLNFDGTDDCDASSICLNSVLVDGELVGECVPFCTGMQDALECPPGYACDTPFEDVLYVCRATCDPLLPDCGPSSGCYWVDPNFSCFVYQTDNPTGSPCEGFYQCAPGNTCVEAAMLPDCAATSCCTNYCDLDLGDAQCRQPGTACVPFFNDGEAPPDYEDIGLCLVP